MTSFVARGSHGLTTHAFTPDALRETFCERTQCKVVRFSKDGRMLAWSDGQGVSVMDVSSQSLICRLPRAKVTGLTISPCASYLCTWSLYTVNADTPAGTPNLHIWHLPSGDPVTHFVQKKFDGWSPQWTDDESVCGRNVSNEVHFYGKGKLGGSPTDRLRLQNVAKFSISPAGSPYRIAAYVPGSKGAPSFVRLYQYPNFDSPSSALANKSFFKADQVELYWNSTGTGLLVLTMVEIDTTGSSYYGEQGLHFVGIDGESSVVPLAKKGPIYSIDWHPNGKEFCVVYGYIPAKATLYNLKSEPIFDFGTGPRNTVHFNCHGNILSLAGFGNLRGHMEFWHRKELKLISRAQASDATFFQWSPDGEHILTATTAPRLREGNGYKVWHYTGKVVHQWDVAKPKDELWEVLWRPSLPGEFPEKPVVMPSHEEQQRQAEATKPAVYRPPGARGKPPSTIKLHEEEPPQGETVKDEDKQQSKSALKNKKRREAKARERESQDAEAAVAMATASASLLPANQSDDLETDKKLRNLKKKLKQIDQLKQQQREGKQLEANQIEKLKTEDDLIRQIHELKVQ
ncbi:eukaryotic translation initiation factor 2A-like isoform X2 [Corticium candelabrum]|uniref:eukaryotic translation initiation factor 2A-like isoform X2 n=1 Tax=Corticium candelabrum TaxID=121492 RepID=UPI002E272A26|nr:eukaryotic translation initiation factor 2A-like isoform X2 [Corticium candelabrum]